ncbi:hypothetical protein D3C76_1309920 [compost metagenome]
MDDHVRPKLLNTFLAHRLIRDIQLLFAASQHLLTRFPEKPNNVSAELSVRSGYQYLHKPSRPDPDSFRIEGT